ncbi:MAG: LysR substrate-binding domain-containing protein [Oligoflexus sp.]
MVTLTQLSYIVAVDRCGSFNKAAKQCFVTQPTLSMQIQKLEDHLGIVIFDRSKQPITTTPPGRKIVDQAKVVLREAERIDEIIHEAQQKVEGLYRLAVIPTLAPYLIPRFTRAFIAKYPKVQLVIEETKTEDIITALKMDQIDAGLLVTPLEDSNIIEHPIFDEPFYVYAPQESDFSKKQLITQSDLPTDRLLLLTEGHCLREQMLNLCQIREELNERESQPLLFESGSIETLINMVDQGHGYTIVPHLAAFQNINRSGKFFHFAAPVPSRQVSLVTHRSSIRKAIFEALLQEINLCLPDELKQQQASTKTIAIKRQQNLVAT